MLNTSVFKIYFSGVVFLQALPNFQHGIGGTFEILSTTRILLRDFSYDGGGPGITLFIGSKG